ncbi:MAG: hypothetical protein AAF902_26480, partial [Chloroflexota bacterium]
MVGVMWLLNPISMWLAVGVGAAVYPLGLWLLGFIGEEERKVLGNILPDGISRRIGLSSAVD